MQNLTVINWISISIMLLILFGGLSLKLYYHKKLKDLDGFMGIIPKEDDGQSNHRRDGE